MLGNSFRLHGGRFAVGLLALAAFWLGCRGEPGRDARAPASGGPEDPSPPLVQDRPVFRGDAAFRLLTTQVDFGPRVPGTGGHARQLAWMDSLLTEAADTVELQPFSFVTSGGEKLALTNVLARFQLGKERRVLLLTHWDTRPTSDMAPDPGQRAEPVPGADDGASGTAVLLRLAQLMAEKAPPIGVDLLFVDGEDYGPGTGDMFLGAREFARTLSRPSPWAYAVLLDMVGDASPRFPVEAHSAEVAPEVVQRVWRVAADLGYGAYFPLQVGPRVTDDHVSLNSAGLPAIDVIDFDYGPQNRFWHTPQDVPDNTSSETLNMVGEVMAELVYQGG